MANTTFRAEIEAFHPTAFQAMAEMSMYDFSRAYHIYKTQCPFTARSLCNLIAEGGYTLENSKVVLLIQEYPESHCLNLVDVRADGKFDINTFGRFRVRYDNTRVISPSHFDYRTDFEETRKYRQTTVYVVCQRIADLAIPKEKSDYIATDNTILLSELSDLLKNKKDTLAVSLQSATCADELRACNKAMTSIAKVASQLESLRDADKNKEFESQKQFEYSASDVRRTLNKIF